MSKRLAVEGPKELLAITINGQVFVESEEERNRKKQERLAKRKSRWDTGSAKKNEKHAAPGLCTMVNVEKMGDDKAQQIYLLHLGIREITQKMGQPNLGIAPNPKDRSPSPEPIYNTKGVRVNTRLERQRTRLQNLRNTSITKLKELDPNYEPPDCMRYKNSALHDKVDIPQEEHPQYNFMGMILGPRGHYLAKLQDKTETRIIIKGKGSVKQGMVAIDNKGRAFEGLDESLHCDISGKSAAGVKEAGAFLRKLIKEQVEDPDGPRMVALRAAHMHDLQVLNGTLKENMLKCLNCGGEGHKTWECPDSANVTSSTICGACGGIGHVTRDCMGKRPGQMWNQSTGGKEMDSEYDSFLKDMGWGPKKAKTEEGPYVPPMGDPGLRGLGGSQGPKLMITHGKFAPGQALKEARYKTARVAIGIAPNSIVGRAYEAPKSIFGGKLHHFNSGYAKQMGLETDKDREKELRHDEEGRYVPTEWQAELQDKKLEEKRERLMMELEHAKLLAKMQKNKEKKAPCGAMGTPPPPPGMVAAAPKKAPDETRWAGSTMDQLQKECRQKGLQPAGNRAVLLGKLKADRDEKAKMEANARPHGLNVDGPPPPPPGAKLRLGPDPNTPIPPSPGPGFSWNGVCWERPVATDEVD